MAVLSEGLTGAQINQVAVSVVADQASDPNLAAVSIALSANQEGLAPTIEAVSMSDFGIFNHPATTTLHVGQVSQTDDLYSEVSDDEVVGPTHD